MIVVSLLIILFGFCLLADVTFAGIGFVGSAFGQGDGGTWLVGVEIGCVLYCLFEEGG